MLVGREGGGLGRGFFLNDLSFIVGRGFLSILNKIIKKGTRVRGSRGKESPEKKWGEGRLG